MLIARKKTCRGRFHSLQTREITRNGRYCKFIFGQVEAWQSKSSSYFLSQSAYYEPIPVEEECSIRTLAEVQEMPSSQEPYLSEIC